MGQVDVDIANPGFWRMRGKYFDAPHARDLGVALSTRSSKMEGGPLLRLFSIYRVLPLIGPGQSASHWLPNPALSC